MWNDGQSRGEARNEVTNEGVEVVPPGKVDARKPVEESGPPARVSGLPGHVVFGLFEAEGFACRAV